jgi:transposase-like protein
MDVIPVFTIIGRNGHEVYIPSRDVSGETVARIASRRIEAGLRIYTDSFPSYSILQGMGYRHEYVNHSMGEYVKGEVHINNCENRASILRPWLSAHRGIFKDNLDAYLSLFQLQGNTNKPPTKNGLRTNALISTLTVLSSWYYLLSSCPDDVMHNCNCSYQLLYTLQLLRVHVVVEPLSPILHPLNHLSILFLFPKVSWK